MIRGEMYQTDGGADPYGYVESGPTCEKCHNDKSWRDCWNCEEGFSYHDCGEDTCCCLYPEDNVRCDVCEGKGGFYVCDLCHPEEP